MNGDPHGAVRHRAASFRPTSAGRFWRISLARPFARTGKLFWSTWLRMVPAASFHSLEFLAAMPGDRSAPRYTLRVITLTFEFPAACDRAGAASIATATIA